ncbi:MAG TPA: hypothetical protein VF587_18400 [Solirubrobacteraceae bacterium]
MLRLLWGAALLVTPLFTLSLIVGHGVNVPITDEWSLVPMFAEWDAGTLSLGDLVRQHHEHVPVFPRTADLLMAPLTDWDLRVAMYRNFAVALVAFALILRALRRTLDGAAFAVAAVVASLLAFSPIQWENWTWGWQLEWFLSNLAALGAFYALAYRVDESPRRGLALAGAAGVVATFSLGQGLLVWPVGLVILLLRRRPWRAWTALGVTVYALYFADWDNPPESGDKTSAFELPGRTLEFVLAYVGRPLGNSAATGRAVAVVLVVAFAVAAYAVLRRGDEALLRRASVWLALGLYVLGAAVITAIARVPGSSGVESRYSVMSSLFAIAVMALAYLVAPWRREVVVAAVAVPLLVAGAVNARAGADALRERTAGYELYARCLHTVRSPDEVCAEASGKVNPAALHGEIVRAWPHLGYLRRKGWAGF